MSRNQVQSQNACLFAEPRHRYRGPAWLQAQAGQGPQSWAWVLLNAPKPDSHLILKALRAAGVVVKRQYAYESGHAAILVWGSAYEIDRFARLVHVHKSWMVGEVLEFKAQELPLPLPACIKGEVLAWPFSLANHIYIHGLDKDLSPRSDLIHVVSVLGEANVVMASRVPVRLGASIELEAVGRSEAFAAIQEMNWAKCLLPKDRADVVDRVEVGESHGAISAHGWPLELRVQFPVSSVDALRPFYEGLIPHLPNAHAMAVDELPPQPGRPVGALAVISMSQINDPEKRRQLEARVRELADERQLVVEMSWRVMQAA